MCRYRAEVNAEEGGILVRPVSELSFRDAVAADVSIVVQMYADDVLGQATWFAESS